jgi:hypothetical protein
VTCTVLDGKLTKIHERLAENEESLLKGPETILFDNHGKMFALTEEGFLVSITDFEAEPNNKVTAKVSRVADLGFGRPLGGRFDKDGTLYIADAHLGLTRLKHPIEENKVELVASRVFDNGNYSQILYANDVVIGSKTG